MRQSRIRNLIPVKVPSRPLHLASAERLGITEDEFCDRMLGAALEVIAAYSDGEAFCQIAPDDVITATAVHDAIGLLRRVTRKRPESHVAWNALAIAYEAINDRKNSRDAFRRAWELDPTEPTTSEGVFWSALHAGEFELAHQAAQSLARSSPDDPSHQSPLPQVEVLMGRFDDALRSIAPLRERWPDNELLAGFERLVRRIRDGECDPPTAISELFDHSLDEAVALRIAREDAEDASEAGTNADDANDGCNDNVDDEGSAAHSTR